MHASAPKTVRAAHIANSTWVLAAVGSDLALALSERTMKKTNDNNGRIEGGQHPHVEEPHGEAALLLSESLLHGLIASSLLTVRQAVDIVDTAVEVRQELAGDHGTHSAGAVRSIAMLSAIRSSLERDLPDPER